MRRLSLFPQPQLLTYWMWIGLCFFNTASSAQKLPTDTLIAKLFPQNTALKWLRYYRGRLDDVSEVLLALGYDGTHCRGYMTYLQSKERFFLNGSFEGNLLILRESDAQGHTTGQLTGTLQSESLQAEWTNAASTLGSSLYAREVKAPNTTPKPCGDNKWSTRYVARWNEARLDMVLSRQSNAQVNGYLWIEAESKIYLLKGRMLDEYRYEVQALLPDGKTAAHLQGNLQNPQAHECLWIGSGEKRTFKLSQRARFNGSCLEYADYASSYDVLYFRTECAPCNETLDRIAEEWAQQVKGTIQAQNPPADPNYRSALRATAWQIISCWTENVFCGQFIFAESWKPTPTIRAFNFDLRSGKEIALEDLFHRNFNARQWLADYARKESPKLPKYAADPAFRQWIAKEGFPIVVIRRDGLEINTTFHPIYGQHRLVVPYSLIKPYMRRDNPIADLVK